MALLKYIFIILILFFFIACDDKKEQDGDHKNIHLDSLQENCRSAIFTPSGFETARVLKNEANKQKSDLYIGHAYKYMLMTALNIGQKDSITYFAEKAKFYFDKIDNKNEIFNIDVSLIEWEMQHGGVYTALDKATLLLEETQDDKYNEFYVYELISNIYNIMGKLNQAETAFLKMLEIKENYSLSVEKQMPYIFLRGAQIETDLKKYEQSLSYCDSSNVYIDRYYNNNDNKTLLILLNLNRTNSLIGLNKQKEAKVSLDILDMLTKRDKENQFYYYIQTAWATYYKGIGDYKKALDYIETVIIQFHKISDIPNYLKAQTVKTEILALMNNYEKAYKIDIEISAFSDSLALAEANKHMNELQTIYQVDKLKNKSERDALKIKHTQTVIVFLAIFCVLLFITIVIVVRKSNALRRKNERLFSQYQEQDKQRDEIISITRYNQKEKSHLSLFEKAELYMNESKAYLDPTITRESLALELGTNRQYLTESIQENKNMTFTEYINDFKLNYSRRLLIQETDLSIDDIYVKAGFNNKSTFYRLFKQKYDLTPKEFQKIAINIKSSSPEK